MNNKKKRIGMVFLVIAMFVLGIGVGVQGKTQGDDSPESIPMIKLQEAQPKEEIKLTKAEISSINKVCQLIDKQEECIKEKNIEGYMETISTDENQYYWEKKHWFDDIKGEDIKNYHLDYKWIKKISDDTFSVFMNQKYYYNEKNYDLEYENIYRIIDGKAYDYDLKFYDYETEHFKVKTIQDNDHVNWILKELEKAYSIFNERTGEDLKEKVILKIYNDPELLRQSVKLSFGWNFGGWYEYPESIKFINNDKKSDGYKYGIVHEMIHMLTMEQSGNNMPYWMAEGLAMYYAKAGEGRDLKKWNVTLSDLELMDLESDEFDNISGFYMNSEYYIRKFIEVYGEEKLNEVIYGLSEYGIETRTAGETYLECNEKFKETVKKILDIDFNTLCDILQE